MFLSFPLAVDVDSYQADKSLPQENLDIVFVGRPLTFRRLEILTCTI